MTPAIRILCTCLITGVGAYAIAAAALYLLQDWLLLPSAPPAALSDSRQSTGKRVDRWKIGGEFAGYVITPLAQVPTGTVLLYHGNEESAETKLPLANVFTCAGYRVAIVEYPGHGKRPGARTMRAALDASREALAESFLRWPGRIWVVGESLGAGMAAQAVRGNRNPLEGVVLITPWDTLASLAQEKYPIFPIHWILHDPFDSVAALAAYDGPLVVIGSARDTLIPIRHARRLADAHPGSELMVLPDADRDNWFDAMSAAHWRQVLQWVKAA